MLSVVQCCEEILMCANLVTRPLNRFQHNFNLFTYIVPWLAMIGSINWKQLGHAGMGCCLHRSLTYNTCIAAVMYRKTEVASKLSRIS